MAKRGSDSYVSPSAVAKSGSLKTFETKTGAVAPRQREARRYGVCCRTPGSGQ